MVKDGDSYTTKFKLDVIEYMETKVFLSKKLPKNLISVRMEL